MKHAPSMLAAALLCVGATTALSPPPLSSLSGDWQDVRMCANSPSAAREVCASPRVTEQQCHDQGCCWDSSNVTLPWCFLPNQPTDWSNPGPITYYGSNQAIPGTMSLRGGVSAAYDFDVAAVTCGALPPFVQECDYDYGGADPVLGFPNALTINGVRPLALPRFQWTPYGMRRFAADTDGTQVTTEVRLLSSLPAILVNVTVGSLPTNAPATVSAFLPLLWRDFSGSTWGWDHPQQPSDITQYAHTLGAGGSLVVSADTQSPAVAAAGVWSSTGSPPTLILAPLAGGTAGHVTWAFHQPGNALVSFGFVMYIGRNASEVEAGAAALAGDAFPAAWAAAGAEWDGIWSDVFTPGNGRFSGQLPLVVAGGNVTAAMERVYYSSIVSLLQCWKLPPMLPSTNSTTTASASLSMTMPWVVPSAAPVKAVTAVYMWDTGYAFPLLTRLEPVGMRALLEAILTIGVHEHYAWDAVSGQGVGPWYSFNDLSTYNLLAAYAMHGAGGNASFWLEEIAGQRAVDWLDGAATYWQQLPAVPSPPPPNASNAGDSGAVRATRPPASGDAYLADYGGASNLLECVPTYLHAVPALNAANVAMMNAAADVWDRLGNSSRAAYLRQQADTLLPLVLNLYAGEGKGYWSCAYPDGSRMDVQHVIDFFTIAEAIGPSLPAALAADMVAFVNTSLLTPTWMRALSLSDPAAPSSDRADHGPWGAYDGWPAKTIDGLLALGYTAEATAMFDRILPVLAEGPFGQSHRVYTNPLLPQLQTGKGTVDQEYAASVSASFAATVLRMSGH